MKNSEKIKNIKNKKLSLLNSEIHIRNLNNSFQIRNNKLKLNCSFNEKVNLSNFKKNLISKITQLQINQQKTNLKLSSLITILLSKLIGIHKYEIISSHFSILNTNKNSSNNSTEIKKYIESHLNTESNLSQNKAEQEKNKSNNANKTNNNVRKIGTISLETELEIRRYTLSNQKTKSREQIFKNKEKKEKNKNLEDKDINFYNNLFKINNDSKDNNNNSIENKRSNYYYSSLNKNSSTENIKISKNAFDRKNINFNEMNQNNINKNYYSGGINEMNKIVFSENNENRRIYINALNIHNNSSHTINNNKSIITESKSTKGPVKIKLNKTEKPVLLINLNENNSNKSNNSNNDKNIIDYSNYSNNKKMTLQIDISDTSKKNKTLDENINNEDIKRRRKYSESKSEAEINFSQLSDEKRKNIYSRKIKGFNFRNNIKYRTREQNSEDDFTKIRGGSVRYENPFSQIT